MDGIRLAEVFPALNPLSFFIFRPCSPSFQSAKAKMITLCSLVLFLSCSNSKSGTFAPIMSSGIKQTLASVANTQGVLFKQTADGTASDDEEWTSLVEDHSTNSPVRKQIIDQGSGDLAAKGATVEIEYTGTLYGEADWTSQDVASCWLSQLQGLDHLSQQFLDNDINAAKLMDDTFFTEEYCMNQLEINNKIQAKKLIMAAKRIAKQQQDHPAGTVFDSSEERGKNFSFVLGAAKVIKAMDLLVSTMKVGERAQLICRSDYGYGSEGLRSSKGDVMVPPFATLCFDIKLVSAD